MAARKNQREKKARAYAKHPAATRKGRKKTKTDPRYSIHPKERTRRKQRHQRPRSVTQRPRERRQPTITHVQKKRCLGAPASLANAGRSVKHRVCRSQRPWRIHATALHGRRAVRGSPEPRTDRRIRHGDKGVGQKDVRGTGVQANLY